MIKRGSAFADGELVNFGGKHPVKIIDADQRARDEYTSKPDSITATRITAYSRC